MKMMSKEKEKLHHDPQIFPLKIQDPILFANFKVICLDSTHITARDGTFVTVTIRRDGIETFFPEG